MSRLVLDPHLKTRIGRRLHGIFLLGIMLPMGAALALSLHQVERQVEREREAELRRGSKQAGLAIFDRLELVDNEVAVLAAAYKVDPDRLPTLTVDSSEYSTPRFRWVGIYPAEGDPVAVLGAIDDVAPVTGAEVEQLASGRPVIRTRLDGGPRILLGRAIDPDVVEKGSVWSEIDQVYLWRAGDGDVSHLSEAELCVFIGSSPIRCAISADARLGQALARAQEQRDGGLFDWDPGAEVHAAGYWTLFLRYAYSAESWTVVLTESRVEMLAPLASFRRTFLIFMALALLGIGLLVNREIRRITTPVVALKNATIALAREEFDTRVEVASDDELGEVGQSFNRMALRLQNAFDERRLLTHELAASAGSLRTIVDSAADGIITCDRTGRVLSMNRTGRLIFGLEDDARPMIDALLPDTIGQGKDLAGVFPEPVELEARRRDGVAFPAEFVVRESPPEAPHAWMIFVRDLTARRTAERERQMMEERLRKAEKLEAIGSMAGGIAHDFNNLLTPLLLLIDSALAEVPEDSEARIDLVEARGAAVQGKDMVRDLFRFSAGESKELEPVPLRRVVEGSVRLLRVGVREGVTVDCEIADDPLVVGDVGQLGQVLMNLGKNSAQAIEPDNGTVTISVEVVEAVAPGSEPFRAPAAHARMSVADDGCGMNPETLERIFEPLYTTKAADDGTGLGLAVVKRIVTEHEGWIATESTPGEGSRFDIYLPLAAAEDEATHGTMERAGSVGSAATALTTAPPDWAEHAPDNPIPDRPKWSS